MQFVQKLLATRGGTVAAAVIAAVLAGAVFLLYLNRYRATVDEASKPVSVLVAKSLIEKGTPGDIVGAEDLFQTTTAPKGELKEGAITDPASLRDRIATHDIYPGQQLTTADFGATAAGDLTVRLSEDERAVTLPFDSAHGMIGQVSAGDSVDVLGGFNVQPLDRKGAPLNGQAQARPVLRVLVHNVTVLETPSETNAAGLAAGGGGSQTSNVTLRVTDEQAAQLAFAADNGKVWIVLRPKTGGVESAPSLVTLETLLLGVKPIQAMRSFGGRS